MEGIKGYGWVVGYSFRREGRSCASPQNDCARWSSIAEPSFLHWHLLHRLCIHLAWEEKTTPMTFCFWVIEKTASRPSMTLSRILSRSWTRYSERELINTRAMRHRSRTTVRMNDISDRSPKSAHDIDRVSLWLWNSVPTPSPPYLHIFPAQHYPPTLPKTPLTCSLCRITPFLRPHHETPPGYPF